MYSTLSLPQVLDGWQVRHRSVCACLRTRWNVIEQFPCGGRHVRGCVTICDPIHQVIAGFGDAARRSFAA
jgi:hypothetical protein